MEFLHPTMAPFTIALMILGLIALLELGGMLFGVAFSGLVDAALPDFGPDIDVDLDIDADIDVDADLDTEIDAGDSVGFIGGFLSWLGVGKTPFLIVLAAFLGAFGVIGVLAQNTANAMFGFYPPTAFTAIGALVAALPVTRSLSTMVARIFPKEESDAVSSKSFVGRIATVIRGEATKGKPVEAKLTDGRGTTQYVLVEPDSDGVTFVANDQILIVEKAGPVFRGVINQNDALGAS